MARIDRKAILPTILYVADYLTVGISPGAYQVTSIIFYLPHINASNVLYVEHP